MNRKDQKRHAQAIVLAALLALSLAVTGSAPALGIGPGEHAAEGIQTAPLASMTLTPTGNTSLQEAHPTTNYSTSPPDELILGRIDGGRARALVEFNIGIIPLGATINQATLRIYQHGYYDLAGSVRTISADRVTSGWHEAVATWNYAPTTGETVGSVGVGMSTGWYEIDVTALVQDWYAGTTPNFGFLLRGHEGSKDYYRLFTPRMYVNEPQLVVEYTLQPTTLVVSPDAIDFMTDGQKAQPALATLEVSNGGTGVMNWSIDLGSTSWLEVNPTSGSTSASYSTPVEISVLTDTHPVGTRTVPITISAAGAQGSPHVVYVTTNYSEGPLAEIFIPLALKDTTGASQPGAQTVALLVGIADYQYLSPPPSSTERTGDWGYDLAYIDQNPHHVRKALLAFVQALTTRIQRNAEAARANIQQGFAWAREEKEKASGAVVARTNVKQGLGWATEQQGEASDTQATIVIAYGGHGGQDATATHLITAYDTNEAGGYFSNAMPGAMLDEWLDDLDSQQIFFLIDACRSGGLLAAIGQPGRVILTATDSTRSAFETNTWNGGVFTHYVTQALMDPGADKNGDGCVSAEESYSYAASRTDAYIQDNLGVVQRPQMYDGVPGELCLTRPPATTAAAVAPGVQAAPSDESESGGTAFLHTYPARLPTMLSPMQR
jgi:hypothetical protein